VGGELVNKDCDGVGVAGCRKERADKIYSDDLPALRGNWKRLQESCGSILRTFVLHTLPTNCYIQPSILGDVRPIHQPAQVVESAKISSSGRVVGVVQEGEANGRVSRDGQGG